MAESNIVEIKGLATQFSGQWVNKDLDLCIHRGEILGIVGGSGAGKTTLLREMILLQQPYAGSIYIFNENILTATSKTLAALQRRWGILFQQNALFSALNILNNVAFPLREHTDLDSDSIEELALTKILFSGLPLDAAIKYPAELSGGMQKRAALARAIALDPELLFLDEPTAGLDPNSAEGIDELILNLQSTMGLTIVMITHDMDTLWRTTHRVAFLGEGKVLAIQPMIQLVKNKHPLIQAFFSGPRNHAIAGTYQ